MKNKNYSIYSVGTKVNKKNFIEDCDVKTIDELIKLAKNEICEGVWDVDGDGDNLIVCEDADVNGYKKYMIESNVYDDIIKKINNAKTIKKLIKLTYNSESIDCMGCCF
jgi:cell division protein FtsI/penicillin-binding protein 2